MSYVAERSYELKKAAGSVGCEPQSSGIMTFGTSLQVIFVFCCLILEKLRLGLQGQLEDVNVYTQEGIHFIQDVRDFMKERIALEEEYADKLEKITKTYSKKSKKFTKLFSTSASRTRKESIASEELAVDDSK